MLLAGYYSIEITRFIKWINVHFHDRQMNGVTIRLMLFLTSRKYQCSKGSKG